MSFDIIINPEYENLIKEIEKLKIQISELMETKNQLIFYECKLIKANYMNKIGTLEYKVYEFDIKYRKLKRKLELYQICINRQEKIIESNIENELDKEYLEYEKKVNEMYEDVQKSLNLKGTILSAEDSQQLKILYRKLIKRLHPDLNPNYSEKEKNLFIQVEKAFENGDLNTLKNIEILIEDIMPKVLEQGELEDLKKQKEKYLNIIQELNLSIAKIKNSFPYNELNFLNDDEKIKIRQKELNATLDNYKIAYKELQDKLNKIKEGL